MPPLFFFFVPRELARRGGAGILTEREAMRAMKGMLSAVAALHLLVRSERKLFSALLFSFQRASSLPPSFATPSLA